MAGNYEFDIPPGGAFITWTFVGNVMLSFSRDGVMPDSRFEEYLAALREHEFTHYFGMGVGVSRLTSVQRKQVSQILKNTEIAVVIGNTVTRGIITALGWLGLKIKSFDWNRLDAAAQYIAPPDQDPEELLRVATMLREASEASERMVSNL